MSFLNVVPQAISTVATNLQDIGTDVNNATAAAAARATAIAAPAADEVSAAIASFFSTGAQEFQGVSARAAAFHDEFVQLLSGGAAQYLNADAANAHALGTAADEGPLDRLTNAWNDFRGWATDQVKEVVKGTVVEAALGAVGIEDSGLTYDAVRYGDGVKVTAGRTVTFDPQPLFGTGSTAKVASVQGTAVNTPTGGYLQMAFDFIGFNQTVRVNVTPGGGLSGLQVTGSAPLQNFFGTQTALDIFKQNQ